MDERNNETVVATVVAEPSALERRLSASLECLALYALCQAHNFARATVRLEMAFEAGVLTDCEASAVLTFISTQEAQS
jgi:hypothetical protein